MNPSQNHHFSLPEKTYVRLKTTAERERERVESGPFVSKTKLTKYWKLAGATRQTLAPVFPCWDPKRKSKFSLEFLSPTFRGRRTWALVGRHISSCQFGLFRSEPDSNVAWLDQHSDTRDSWPKQTLSQPRSHTETMEVDGFGLFWQFFFVVGI